MDHRVSLRPLATASVLATALLAPRAAQAACDRLTPRLAARVSAAVEAHAPAWARPLLTARQLSRFDSAGLHELTYFLGYGAINLERLGLNGAPPFTATVVVRCRDGAAEFIADPYVWANAHARALHLTMANAEQAAGFAAEVVSLGRGRRPDAANASRRGPVFIVDVSMAPHQGDPAGAETSRQIEVGRDASIRLLPATP